MATFKWLGNGTTNNWTEAANWSLVSGTGSDADGIPDTDDVASFDGTSTKDATINANFSIQNLQVAAAYTGSISLGSNTLAVSGGLAIANASSFDSGTGTVRFTGNQTVDSTAALFNLEVATATGSLTLVKDLVVNNDLTISEIGAITGNGGTFNIKVSGDVITNDANFSNTNSAIQLVGSTDQSISGTGVLVNLDVAKTGGDVLLTDDLRLRGGTLSGSGLLKNAGGNAGGKVIFGEPNNFLGDNYTSNFTGSIDDVELKFHSGSNFILGKDLVVNNDLTISEIGAITGNGGTFNIKVSGDVITNDANFSNTNSAIQLVGSTDQSISGTGVLVNLDVAKTGGDVLLTDDLRLRGGTLSGSGLLKNAGGNAGGKVIFGEPNNFLNDSYTSNFSGSIDDVELKFHSGSNFILSKDLVVNNDLTISEIGAITGSGGTFNIKVTGDVITNDANFSNTNSAIQLVGSTDQSISGTGVLVNLDVAKTGGDVLLTDDLRLRGGTLSGSGLLKNAGGKVIFGEPNNFLGDNYTSNFSGSIDDVELKFHSGSNFILSKDLVVNNDLTITQIGAITSSGFSIKVAGDVISSDTNGISGTGAIALVGSATNTFTGLGSGTQGNLVIDKTTSTDKALLGSSETFSSVVVNEGIFDVNGKTATAGTTINSGGTLGGSGTVIGNVTVNSGGVLAPGSGIGILNTRSVNFANGSLFNVELGGTSAGNGVGFYDQLNVTGTVTIGTSAVLNTSLFGGFTPGGGNTFIIVNNDGTDAISGRFNGLAQGATVNLGSGINATISYTAGDGNDIGLSLLNQAPNLTSNGTLAAVAEDTTNPNGQTISTVFNGLFSDLDAGASLSGVAVVGNTANTTTQGTWQYSTNGTNWFDVGTVADGATALALSAGSAVRFVPVANYNGTPPALTVRALDNTYSSGFTSGGTRVNVNTGTNGGTTAISATTNTINTSITAVNDAPIGSPTATLVAGIEDTAYTITAASLLQGFTDVEGNTLSVQNLSATNGSIISNGNGTYTFNPTANYNGTVNLTYNVVDGNSGVTPATQSFSLAAVTDVSLAAGITPTEAGTTGTFVITLDAPAPVGGLTLNYNLSGSTATIPADYSLTAGTNVTGLSGSSFTVAAGATTATLQVAAVNDGIADPNETVQLNLATGSGYTLGYNSTTPFRAAPSVPVGSFPYSIATGDVNGDGKLDMVVANQSSANVSVRLGDGTGNFTGNISVPTGGLPYFVALGDVNGDGHLDLATATDNAGYVAVRLGDGTGNFSGSTNVSTGGRTVSVALGDINGDGKLDLVASHLVGGGVAVRLGDGTGNFTGTTNITGLSLPYNVTLSDINGDNKLDLLLANQGTNAVVARLGDGTGNFSGNISVPTELDPLSLAVGDINGDGNLDILAANYTSNSVSVRLGDGIGNFSGTTTIAVGVRPVSTAVGDINGDGNLDFFTANSSSNYISVGLGDGTGNFSVTNIAVSGGQRGVTPSDVNGDGKLDLLVANGNVSVLLNNTGNAALTITDAPNSAPSFTSNATLAAVAEDTTSPSGQTISTLFNGLFSDPNAGASLSGVAVVGNGSNPTTQGTWQYTTNGTNWFDVGNVVDGATALALSAGSAVRFVPVANYNGTPPTLTVRALDNTYSSGFTSGGTRVTVNTTTNGGTTAISATTNTINTSITAVNDAPVLATNTLSITEGATVILSASNLNTTDSDTPATGLTYTVSNVTGGQFESVTNPGTAITSFTQNNINNGAVQFVHNGGEAAPAYSVSVSDGVLSTPLTAVSIGSFTSVNDAPVLATNTLSITEGGTVTFSSSNLNTSDSDNTPAQLLYTISNISGGSFSGTGVTTNSNGTVSFTQAAINNGLVQFVHNGGENPPSYAVSVSDGTLSTTPATVTIPAGGFTPVNDAPTGTPTATLAAGTEDTVYTISQTALLQGFTDVEGNTLSVADLTASNGTLVNNNNGTYTFTPAANFNGTVNLSYNVVDGNGGSVTATQSFAIAPVNDAPVLVTNTLSITEGGTVTLSSSNLNASDSDNTPSQLLYTISNISGGTFSGTGVTTNGNGSVSFTQAAINNGLVQFTHNGGENPPSYAVSVNDGALNTTPATVTIPAGSFTPVNDAPVLTTNTLSITEGGTVTLSSSHLNTSDSDNTPAQLLYTISNISGGSFSGTGVTTNGNGSVSFTQAAINNGLVQFTHNGGENPPSYAVSVSDGALNTSPATVTIPAGSFIPVNDAPTVVGQGIEDQIISINQSFSFDISNKFSDVDQGDTLTYSATGMPSGFGINANTGIVSGTISSPGIFNVNVTANDGHGGAVSDAFELIVANNNATPFDDIIYMSQLTGSDKDKVNAKEGRDRVIGTSANEFIGGAEDADYLDGQGGNDKLLGGDGNDTLIGGLGSDDLQGGDGNDTLTGWGSGTGSANQIDELKSGNGADLYILGNSTSVFYNLGGYNDYVKIVGFEADDRIQLKGTASNYSLGSLPSSVSTDKASIGIFTNSGTELIAVLKNEGLTSTSLTTDARFIFV